MDAGEDEENSSTDEEDESRRAESNDREPNRAEETLSSESSSDPSKDEPIVDENQVIPDMQQFEKDKKSVYKHPLFPLLALLLEKCEYATGTLNVSDEKNSSSSSFNSEIQAFVEHQQRDGKPFLSDDPEVDALMIKAIQVLRIHLLELEKVQELCKDFCQRYITCLRTKMNSENLLRGTTGVAGNASFDGSSCSSPSSDEGSSGPITFPTLTPSNPQTVYQMVQMPRGLVAQQVQVTSTNPTPIEGSTPMSQIGNTVSNSGGVGGGGSSGSKQMSAIAPRVDSGNEGDLSDDASNANSKKSQKRGVLPKQATSVMRSWLFQHIVHPYPTEDEKRSIAAQTNLTLLQVNNWFINARRRILQPMLDSANSLNNESAGSQNGSSKNGGLAKKLKTCSKNASLQRFWPESIATAIQANTGGKDADSK